MGYLQSLAAWFVVSSSLLAVICQGELQLLVKTINRCEGSKYSGLPVVVGNLFYTMTPENGNIMLNGFINVKKQINDMYVIFEIGRCFSEDTNSCQHFVTMNYTDFCQEVHKKDMMWSTIVENVKGLPETCPILPGKYEMDHAYIDLVKSQETFKFPAGNWKAVLKFFQTGELLSCYYVIATVKPSRKRKTLK